MQRIIFYHLAFRPGGNGRLIFRVSGEQQNRLMDLSPTDFAAIAAVLAQKFIRFDPAKGVFASTDDDDTNPIPADQLASII